MCFQGQVFFSHAEGAKSDAATVDPGSLKALVSVMHNVEHLMSVHAALLYGVSRMTSSITAMVWLLRMRLNVDNSTVGRLLRCHSNLDKTEFCHGCDHFC